MYITLYLSSVNKRLGWVPHLPIGKHVAINIDVQVFL